MTDLERLFEERAIERLILDYAAANDAGDWDRVAGMYVEDGRMNRPTAPGEFVEGREAILAAFKARPARTSRHIVANVRIEIKGSGAQASSQLLLFTGAGLPPLVGTYEDRLIHTPAGWRFAERCGSLDFPA